MSTDNKSLKPFWSSTSNTLTSYLPIPTDEFKEVKFDNWFTVSRSCVDDTNRVVLHPDYIDSIISYYESKVTIPNNKPSSTSLKTKKIKLLPDDTQKVILRKWFGASRWTYNRSLHLIKNEGCKRNKKVLRNLCVNEKAINDLGDEFSTILETPYDIRDAAVAEVLTAYKSNFTKLRNELSKRKISEGEKNKRFELKYRSKKDPSQSIHIQHNHQSKVEGGDKEIMIFPTHLKKRPILVREPLPEIKHDYTINWDTVTDQFYICIPVEIDTRGVSNNYKIIALDPGVRTFLTGYDHEGLSVKIGSGDISRFYRLCYSLDKLQSRISGKEHDRNKNRRRMKEASVRIREKISNIRAELHNRVATSLCSRYEIILIPSFETSGMVMKGHRKLNSKTVRGMLTFAHYKFRQTLIHKAREYPNCRVIVVTEEYTSKTCGRCGQMNNTLGGKKIFKCNECGLRVDRDVNGARNILLKFLTEFSSL